jgi:hypothetical protein
MEVVTLQVLVVVFIATFIRSAFGFGEALVAVPLLALCIPLKVAAPLAVLVSITIAAVVVAQDWRKIHVRSTGWLFASTLLGIPFGLMLLTSIHQQVVKIALAIFILLFSAYSLIGSKPPELKRDSLRWLGGCGFFAGVLGGAYGMNGPPAGDLWRYAPMVCTTFSRDVARIFSPCEHYRHGWLLADGTVGPAGDALLSALPACLVAGDLAGQGGESSSAWREFSSICLFWIDGHRYAVAGTVAAPIG